MGEAQILREQIRRGPAPCAVQQHRKGLDARISEPCSGGASAQQCQKPHIVGIGSPLDTGASFRCRRILIEVERKCGAGSLQMGGSVARLGAPLDAERYTTLRTEWLGARPSASRGCVRGGGGERARVRRSCSLVCRASSTEDATPGWRSSGRALVVAGSRKGAGARGSRTQRKSLGEELLSLAHSPGAASGVAAIAAGGSAGERGSWRT